MKIHVPLCLDVRGIPKALRLFRVSGMKRLDRVRKPVFPGQGDVVQLRLQALFKLRQVVGVELSAALLLTHKGEEKRGIHPLG